MFIFFIFKFIYHKSSKSMKNQSLLTRRNKKSNKKWYNLLRMNGVWKPCQGLHHSLGSKHCEWKLPNHVNLYMSLTSHVVFHRILNSSSDVQIKVILQSYQSHYVFISCSYHSLKILLLTQRTHYHGYLMLTHSSVKTQSNVHLNFLHILADRVQNFFTFIFLQNVFTTITSN